MILVREAGALTTVQDLGRHRYAHLGVSAAGAADPVSLRVGNRLVGNPDGAAGLELTLVGGAFEIDAPTVAAVTGSDFGATLESRSAPPRAIAPWTAFEVEPGGVLRFGVTRSGARAYLCIAGGIATPLVLGSRSTHLATRLGGLDGGPLRVGQSLPVGPNTARFAPAAVRAQKQVTLSAEALDRLIFSRTLRFTPGLQSKDFPGESRETLRSVAWEISESADRSGLRLVGPALQAPSAGSTRTEGVCSGAVQVPGDGRPIVLFADQQTTGGYPKIANVIAADLPAIGQLRPRDQIRFEEVSLPVAIEILKEQEHFVTSAVTRAGSSAESNAESSA